VDAPIDLVAPLIELELEVERVGKAPPRLEAAVQIAVAALERALGLAITWVEDDPAERQLPQKARKSSVGRPLGAIAPSRSQTSLSGSAPRRARQRAIPKAMSANSFEKTSAPQKARE
jgi:hypothetical protein